MNSTDRQQTEDLTRFYEAEILTRSRANGMEILDHAPPRSAPSYFIDRARTRMAKSDFEVELGDEKLINQTLEAQWAGTPLRGLGKPLARLACRLPEEPEKELSASLYEMF